MGLHLVAQPSQIENRIDPPQQMIVRHHVFEIKFIEKTVLKTDRVAHHRQKPSPKP
jgi:hypothetical protein